MKMNPEKKRLWLEALRSGKYKQDQNFLRNLNDGFCCLGVLCDISNLAEWKVNPTRSAYYYLSTSSFLPPEVTEWAELGYEDDVLIVDDIIIPYNEADYPAKELILIKSKFISSQMSSPSIHLSVLNDRGISFNTIANLVEKYL